MTIQGNITTIRSRAFCGCGLTSIIIPKRVVNIGSKAFEKCANLTIYAETVYKLDGWEKDWNAGCPVIWGCTLSKNEDYVVSFIKIADNTENLSLNEPYREGYDFEGWFSFENEQIYNMSNFHTAQDGITLFAVWEKVNPEKNDKIARFYSYECEERDLTGLTYKFDKIIIEELKEQIKKIIEIK